MLVGNMGQSLRFGPEDDEEGDEYDTGLELANDADYSGTSATKSIRVSAVWRLFVKMWLTIGY